MGLIKYGVSGLLEAEAHLQHALLCQTDVSVVTNTTVTIRTAVNSNKRQSVTLRVTHSGRCYYFHSDTTLEGSRAMLTPRIPSDKP